MERRILYIGGSPCSGKSTAAQRISEKYGAFYFKVDARLAKYIRLAAAKGCPCCKKVLRLSAEEIWMRDPAEQCEEEFRIYEEISAFVFADLDGVGEALIVTEGAAYTPEVMSARGTRDYISIVPTPEFQISRYRERPWIKDVLAGCSDKARAFDNWMQRDVLFAARVRKECAARGVPCLVNDGSATAAETLCAVEARLCLL